MSRYYDCRVSSRSTAKPRTKPIEAGQSPPVAIAVASVAATPRASDGHRIRRTNGISLPAAFHQNQQSNRRTVIEWRMIGRPVHQRSANILPSPGIARCECLQAVETIRWAGTAFDEVFTGIQSGGRPAPSRGGADRALSLKRRPPPDPPPPRSTSGAGH